MKWLFCHPNQFWTASDRFAWELDEGRQPGRAGRSPPLGETVRCGVGRSGVGTNDVRHDVCKAIDGARSSR